MNIVVTGGAGFIGSAVLVRLREQGYSCTILDRPFDILTAKLKSPFSNFAGADAVIHLAGMLGTHELFDDAERAVDVNVKGTLRVLKAAAHFDLAYVGITMPAVFPSVYTATKLGAAALERAYHHTFDVPVSRVRAFNAYGPGQKHGAGHPQKIVPTFAVEAWAGRPIPIWGDGLQTVDLIHVDDLAHMLVDALHYGDDATFDGGTGQAFTVLDVAEMVLAVTGSKAGVQHLPMRRGEVPTQIVAEGEGWERLYWKPTFDVDMFAATVESYR